MKYNIYPKTTTTDIPAPVSIECEGWQRDGLLIRPLNAFNQPSQSALMLTSNIAAMLPEVPPKPIQNLRDPFHFQVYLNGRTKPIEVIAHDIQVTEERVQFGWLVYNEQTSTPDVQPISEIYVLLSEVVAIVPSEPLPHINPR
jgi:hypothetical protein